MAILITNFIPQTATTDFSKFKKDVDAFEKSLVKDSPVILPTPINVNGSATSANKLTANEIHYFRFNPNHLPDSLWMKLGLSEKQIHVIKNYETKGGHFYKKEDVQKMYCITPALYASLAPYIVIEDNSVKSIPAKLKTDSVVAKTAKQTPPLKIIELNIADEEQLDAVPGIGKVFATNIIKYRNFLGGFDSKEQLLEVWHYSDSLYAVTEKYFTVNKVYVQQKNVNTGQPKQLRHPYINWDMINKITVYRKQFGNIDSFEKLKKATGVSDSTLLKLNPYIKFAD